VTQTVLVRFEYEDHRSIDVPIKVELDLSNNSNRRKLANKLLKLYPDTAEVSILSITTLL